jgi:hypothetical protein
VKENLAVNSNAVTTKHLIKDIDLSVHLGLYFMYLNITCKNVLLFEGVMVFYGDHHFCRHGVWRFKLSIPHSGS